MKSVLFILATVLLFSLSYKDKEKPYEGFSLKKFEKSLKYIPTSVVFMGRSDSEVPFPHMDRNNINHYSFSHDDYNPIVDSFFMYNKEVSNGEYMEFLTAIKSKDTVMYNNMLPDTLAWRTNAAYWEPYVEYYLRHRAFSNYPVVGVTYTQATAYCEWLTQKYLEIPKRNYKKVKFKLPTLQQWVAAARGGSNYTIFPWEGYKMQDEKGNWLANFKIIDQKSVGVLSLGAPDYKNEIQFRDYYVGQITSSFGTGYSDATLKVESFNPNAYGLYQMAGNVSEYVEEFGIIKGGSWNTTGYYLQNDIHQRYDSTNLVALDRGFRFVMEVIAY